MMRHMLMDPAFPDLVGAAAAAEQERKLTRSVGRSEPEPEDAVDAFLTLLGKLEIAPGRLW